MSIEAALEKTLYLIERLSGKVGKYTLVQDLIESARAELKKSAPSSSPAKSRADSEEELEKTKEMFDELDGVDLPESLREFITSIEEAFNKYGSLTGGQYEALKRTHKRNATSEDSTVPF